jgi:hypothetical protein
MISHSLTDLQAVPTKVVSRVTVPRWNLMWGTNAFAEAVPLPFYRFKYRENVSNQYHGL